MRRVRLLPVVAALNITGAVIFLASAARACSSVLAGLMQPTPSPEVGGPPAFPEVWLVVGGGLAVAALILYFLHVRRL